MTPDRDNWRWWEGLAGVTVDGPSVGGRMPYVQLCSLVEVVGDELAECFDGGRSSWQEVLKRAGAGAVRRFGQNVAQRGLRFLPTIGMPDVPLAVPPIQVGGDDVGMVRDEGEDGGLGEGHLMSRW